MAETVPTPIDERLKIIDEHGKAIVGVSRDDSLAVRIEPSWTYAFDGYRFNVPHVVFRPTAEKFSTDALVMQLAYDFRNSACVIQILQGVSGFPSRAYKTETGKALVERAIEHLVAQSRSTLLDRGWNIALDASAEMHNPGVRDRFFTKLPDADGRPSPLNRNRRRVRELLEGEKAES